MKPDNAIPDEAGKTGSGLDTIEKMHVVAGWLNDKQAQNIIALDVAGICSIAEGLILASVKTVRHAQALADHVLKSCKELGVEFMGMEGYRGGSWILLDLNDVLVHIFRPEARQFYNLEGLWSEAESLELDLAGSEQGGQE